LSGFFSAKGGGVDDDGVVTSRLVESATRKDVDVDGRVRDTGGGRRVGGGRAGGRDVDEDRVVAEIDLATEGALLPCGGVEVDVERRVVKTADGTGSRGGSVDVDVVVLSS
jgi:hypothetical protein